MRPLRVLALAVAMGLGAVAASATAAPACHRNDVRPVADRRAAYQPRVDRCEGLYRQPVASIRLELVSFVAGRAGSAALSAGAPSLGVRVLGPTAGRNILLSAVSLRPLTFYAMDTTRLAADGRFRWSSALAASPPAALRADELGALACTAACDATAFPVHLPVAFESPAPSRPGGYQLTVRAERRLNRVTWRLTDQRDREEGEEVVTGPFSPREPIRIDIANPGPGLHILSLVARADDGSEAPLRVRLEFP